MNLVIFDVDGTLTRTVEVDELCFLQAIRAEFGGARVSTDWSHYPHATDSGIARVILQDQLGRPPANAEIARVRSRFVALLRERIDSDREPLREIDGASTAIRRLRAHPQWCVAIATGCWRDSALLKLEAASVVVRGIPLATADDVESREGIVRTAASRARLAYGVEKFARVVCVGDAVWDVRAARKLGCPFVGVASAEARSRLLREGASALVEDFVDFERFLGHLDQAPVPGVQGD